MKRITAIILFVSCLTLSAQEVVKVNVGDNQDHGVTYCLPAQTISIHAMAVCTTFKAGIFAPYAEKYLGLTDAPLEDNVSWQLTNLQMESHTVADTSRTFHVLFNEKLPMPTFYLSKDNLLLGINKEPEGTVYVVTTAAETPASESAVEEIHAVNVMNEELLKAGSKAKQAEIAARQIFRIRESRMNLLTGDVEAMPADGQSFQLILDNLKAQEAAYMELFTGVTTTSSAQRDFYLYPRQAESRVLFRFSRHFGFVEADDLSGEPYELKVSITEDKRQVPVLLDVKGKPKPVANGIAHCIPGKGRVTVSFKGTILAEQDRLMSQFGHVEYLSSTQFNNKKMPASALFSPETGAVQLFSVEVTK